MSNQLPILRSGAPILRRAIGRFTTHYRGIISITSIIDSIIEVPKANCHGVDELVACCVIESSWAVEQKVVSWLQVNASERVCVVTRMGFDRPRLGGQSRIETNEQNKRHASNSGPVVLFDWSMVNREDEPLRKLHVHNQVL